MNVTIVCNNGNHNKIKTNTDINKAAPHKDKITNTQAAKKQKPKESHMDPKQQYAHFVPGDTYTISLRAQRILPQGSQPVTSTFASASVFNTSDVRMLPDGHLAVVIWAQMSQGPVIIETSYDNGPEGYYLAQNQVKTYLYEIRNNIQPLIEARNHGFIVLLASAPESNSVANTTQPASKNRSQYQQPQYGTRYQQPSAPTYSNKGYGYNGNGNIYYDINLQNIQRN